MGSVIEKDVGISEWDKLDMGLLKEEEQLVEVEAFEDGGDSLVGFSAMSDYKQK